MGRTTKEVVAMREARRIALSTSRSRWTARETLLLGKMPDAEVGRRLRCSNTCVRKRRVALHIPPFQPRPEWRVWTAKEIRLLGTMRDEDLARKLHRTPVAVETKRLSAGIACFAPKRRP
jgi:hypothetical protein